MIFQVLFDVLRCFLRIFVFLVFNVFMFFGIFVFLLFNVFRFFGIFVFSVFMVFHVFLFFLESAEAPKQPKLRKYPLGL